MFPGLPVQIANASAAVIYKMAIAFEHTVPAVLLPHIDDLIGLR